MRGVTTNIRKLSGEEGYKAGSAPTAGNYAKPSFTEAPARTIQTRDQNHQI